MELQILSIILSYVTLIIFACQYKRVKDITSLDIVYVGLAFFYLRNAFNYL
jgi:hypothetical protein